MWPRSSATELLSLPVLPTEVQINPTHFCKAVSKNGTLTNSGRRSFIKRELPAKPVRVVAQDGTGCLKMISSCLVAR